jgi:hypothetical protein
VWTLGWYYCSSDRDSCNGASGSTGTVSLAYCDAGKWLSPGTGSCVDIDGCIGRTTCSGAGDTAAVCVPPAAGGTGFTCACSAGFAVNTGYCVKSNVLFSGTVGSTNMFASFEYQTFIYVSLTKFLIRAPSSLTTSSTITATVSGTCCLFGALLWLLCP